MSAGSGFGKRQGGIAPSRYAQTYSPAAAPAPAVQMPNISPDQYAHIMGSQSQGAQHSGYSVGIKSVDNIRPAVWMRFASGLIDFTILVVLTFLVMFAFDAADGGLAGGDSPEILADTGLALTLLALWFGYGLLFESSSWQGTPGKKITGLVITNKMGERIGFGQALARAFGKMFSTFVPLYIPYWMVFSTERKQSLHDMMVGTLVFKRSDLENASSVFD